MKLLDIFKKQKPIVSEIQSVNFVSLELSKLNKYLRHQEMDSINFEPIELGQLTLKTSLEYNRSTKYEYFLWYKNILLFTGFFDKNENGGNYTGKWLHDGKWQKDIFIEIEMYLERRKNEHKFAEEKKLIETKKVLETYQ